MGRAPLALALGAVIVLAGCATGPRIENGIYHSAKGYRVTMPGADWSVAGESKADLQLRHQDGMAAMLDPVPVSVEIGVLPSWGGDYPT